jgi:hypothetical protein
MELVSLVYYSCSRIPPGTTMDDEVSRILAASVTNNKRVDVTGGLVYDGHWFAQVLEGDRVDVIEIFEHIAGDSRHSDINKIGLRSIPERRFGYWWMGGASWDPRIADLFALAHGGLHFDPRGMSAEALTGFFAAVIDLQLQRSVQPQRRFAALPA